MFPNGKGQKHLVRNAEAQWGSKQKGTHRTESEKVSCLKQDRQITEERDKCGQNRIELAVLTFKSELYLLRICQRQI